MLSRSNDRGPPDAGAGTCRTNGGQRLISGSEGEVIKAPDRPAIEAANRPSVWAALARPPSFLPAILLLTLLGCAASGPRFAPYVAAGFAREPMRHLETEHVELYYPQSYAEAARHIVARLDHCAAVLQSKPVVERSREKLLVYLTLANFNNAYVQAQYSGQPLLMVLPIHSTLEEDNFLLLGTVNLGNTACHESLHYVQDQQTHDFWWIANKIGGDLATPSQGLERWFTEGLAVWTEGHIDLETGRPHSPFWNGMFAAAMTTRGNRPRSGDLDLNTRDLYGSGAYLTSQHFIDFLIRHYGEEKLWELIDREAGAVVPDVGISLLFKSVYGNSLGVLIKTWGDEMVREPVRQRPKAQQVIGSDAGEFARIAVSPADGSIAEISSGDDYPLRLVIRDPGGWIRRDFPLTRFLPGREWVGLTAQGISGLRFSSDGNVVFFVGDSTGVDGDDTTALFAVDAKTGQTVGHWDLFGYGGDVGPDNLSYLYVEVRGDTESLVRIDLRTGKHETISTFEGARSIGAPAYAPDGKRIAFALWNGSNFDLALREADGHITTLTNDGRTNYGPRWIDDQHLVFLREKEGRWQVYAYNLGTRMMAPISDAPYLALDPMPRSRGDVVFLNREGVHFSIDALPLTADEAHAEHGAPEEPPPAMPSAAIPPVKILRDQPAHQGERLGIPSLHVPVLTIQPALKGPWEISGGLSLAGSDRLGIHNYDLTVTLDSFTYKHGPSFALDYYLAAWAPSVLSAHVSRSLSVGAENRQASIAYDRSFWDVPVHIAFLGQQQLESAELGGVPNAYLVGPSASVSYEADETTPYGGIRRSIRLSLSASVYPAFLGSSATVGDVRPGIGFTIPLPISARHSLALDVFGHVALGDGSLIEVGGLSPGYALLSSPVPSSAGISGAPPILQLAEYLRGYEEHTRFTDRVVIGQAVYDLPIIIDRGQTSFLWVLPSVWVSQVDVNLFGAGAWLDSGYLRSVGGSVTLSTIWGQETPIALTYQFAYRFDDNLPPLHLVYLSF